MILDAALKLTTSAFVLTGASVDSVSTDWVDLMTQRNIGGTEPLRIMIHFTATFVVDTGAPTFQFDFYTADDAAFSSGVIHLFTTANFGNAAHLGEQLPIAGNTYDYPIPSIPNLGENAAVPPDVSFATGRFIKGIYNNTSADPALNWFNAGAVDIYITKDVAHKQVIYPGSY